MAKKFFKKILSIFIIIIFTLVTFDILIYFLLPKTVQEISPSYKNSYGRGYPQNHFVKNDLRGFDIRPNFSTKLLKKIISELKSNKCVVPTIKTNDTVKIKNKNKIKNLNRKNIYLTQTPQGFDYKELLKLQSNQDVEITDDSSLFIKHKKKIKIIKGENENIKITTNNDVIQKTFLKYGIGFDVHRLGTLRGNPSILAWTIRSELKIIFNRLIYFNAAGGEVACGGRIVWPLRRIANPMGFPTRVQIPLVAPSTIR